MSIKSGIRRCRRCRALFLYDPGNVVKGCPYCIKKDMERVGNIRAIFRKIGITKDVRKN